MVTRLQELANSPVHCAYDMMQRWTPQNYTLEAVRIASVVMTEAPMTIRQTEDLFCSARRREEHEQLKQIFVSHADEIASPVLKLPMPRFHNADFALSRRRIASACAVARLRQQHHDAKDICRDRFALTSTRPDKQHVISLAGTLHGEHLARYLGVDPQNVLTINSGKAIRDGGLLRFASSTYRRVQKNIASYAQLAQMYQGSVAIVGHYHFDKIGGRALCGWLSADELINLLGENFRPRALNLFFCGSHTFGQELMNLLAPRPHILNTIKEDTEICIFPKDAREDGFYYSGTDVQQTAGHLFEQQGNLLDVLETYVTPNNP